MSLESDCLLAVTGVAPSNVTVNDFAKSQDVQKRMDAKIKAWLKADPKPFEYRDPPKDMEALFKKLQTGVPQTKMSEWMDAIGVGTDSLADQYAMSLMNARKYIVDKWPAITITDTMVPETLPLAPDDEGDMAALFYVMDDLLTVLFVELEQQTLEPAQAEAFRTCFPDLWAWTDRRIQLITGELVAHGWIPTWEKDSMLRILKGVPPEPVFSPPPPVTPPVKPTELDTKAKATQTDLAAQPIGRENAAGS